MYRLNECVTPLSLGLLGSFTRANEAHAPLSSLFLLPLDLPFIALVLSHCDYQAMQACERWVQETIGFAKRSGQ